MNIEINPLQESELAAADFIYRLAFGTFQGLSDPLRFGGDADPISTRWRTDPNAALGCKLDDRLVASNFLANWGTFGFFGPLTVHPDFWNKGIAKALLKETMKIFSGWNIKHIGLFTHAESPKHLSLYQKFGFWPRFLTVLMSCSIGQKRPTLDATCLSQVSARETGQMLKECRLLTDQIHRGLDVTREIKAVREQQLGDTLLLWGKSRLVGFAVCHCGAGTEAGSDVCYIKFAGVSPGPNAAETFAQLLDQCEKFAALKGLSRIVAGINTARQSAYRMMLERGYVIFRSGVAMHKPNEPGYNRSLVFVLDDWR